MEIDYKKLYEETKKLYDDTLEKAKEINDEHKDSILGKTIEYLFPQLKDSEDERIRTALIEAFETNAQLEYDIQKEGLTYKEVVAYLERQKPTIDETSYRVGIKRVLDNPESYGLVRKEDGGQFFNMVPWKGDNLKQVVKFTGKSPKFDEWFKTWEDFENYVHSHNNIFKIFNEDGSHYEVPVGAWIIKTPDGHSLPSKYTLKQKSKESTEEDERIRKELIKNKFNVGCMIISNDYPNCVNTIMSIVSIQNDEYLCRYRNGQTSYKIEHIDDHYRLVTIQDIINLTTRQWKHIDEEVYVKEPVIAQKKNKTDMFGGYVLCADHILNPKTYERYIKVDDIAIQPHWKPTEEQMNAVFEAYCYTSNIYREKILRELFNDLKKLYKSA